MAMATILVALVVAVVGALAYALSSNGKMSELGRILFFVGAFWCVYETLGKAVHF